MKHNYQNRKTKRIENAKKQAEKNQQLSTDLYNQASAMASVIPFGQPILIGHHSEKGDRNYREKIHNKFGKSFEAEEKAKYYEQKAETIENNDAISSDDPDALQKLKEKLESLQRNQEFMKAANNCIRKKDKDAFLKLPHATEEMWVQITTPDKVYGLGFTHFTLSNNSANIRRIKDRIALMEKVQAMGNTEEIFGDVKMIKNVDANRLQLIFNGVPPQETRNKLKSNGFRWAPSEGAWQRHLTPNAIYVAKRLLTELNEAK